MTSSNFDKGVEKSLKFFAVTSLCEPWCYWKSFNL